MAARKRVVKSQRDRDLERLAEIRRLDAEREFKRMGNVEHHNAEVISRGVQSEKARREQNNIISAYERRERLHEQRVRGKQLKWDS